MNETDIIQQNQDENVMQVPVQASVNVWNNKEAFEQVGRVANMLSKSSIVPEAYRGKPEDCFIAVELAARMNTSPIFIMQSLYVVKGKPSWAGQACMAMIQSCGKFKNVRPVYTGQRGSDNRGCYVEAVRVSNGETVTGTEITLKMAKDEGWMNNSKWRNMPEQMLGYRAASFFARMYCPEAMMGLQTTEEIYDANPGTTSPDNALVCEECGREIAGNKRLTPEQIASGTRKKYGRALCLECGQKAKAEAEAAKKSDDEQSNPPESAEPVTEPDPESKPEEKKPGISDLAAQLMADAEA